jgi:glycerol-3-phosphate acyltransferase PlsY
MLSLGAIAVLSYLLGSIPFSIIVSRLVKGIDIREHGSKNAGASNVFRVVGPVPGVMVLLLDAFKGLAAVLFVTKLSLQSGVNLDPVYLKLLAAVSATLGHVYTIFAGFKGGKGIGTGAGALLGLIPRELGLALILFAIIVLLTRYISLGSLAAAAFISLLVAMERFILKVDIPFILVLCCWLLTLFVFYTHRNNIRRLLTGTEQKIGRRPRN